MALMRFGSPRTWFCGEKDVYIYNSFSGVQVHHWSEFKKNDESIAELVGVLAERATGDEKFADMLVRLVADKMGIADKLRPRRLTEEEVDDIVLNLT